MASDGPYHGDRVAQPLSATRYQALIVNEGVDVVAQGMIADWQRVIAAIGMEGLADAMRLGYLRGGPTAPWPRSRSQRLEGTVSQ